MGGSYKKVAKVLNPIPFLQKPFKGTAIEKWTTPPLSGWVSGEKSFNESLRTDGTPVERSVNSWLLNVMGVDKKPENQFYPMTKGLSRDPQYFAQQQQMLANMRKQQQAKLTNLRTQGEIYPTATTPAQVSQVPQAATTAPSTTALAQSKVGDTTAPSDMPTEFIYKPATATTKSVAANTFQMPDMSSIKFGGA